MILNITVFTLNLTKSQFTKGSHDPSNLCSIKNMAETRAFKLKMMYINNQGIFHIDVFMRWCILFFNCPPFNLYRFVISRLTRIILSYFAKSKCVAYFKIRTSNPVKHSHLHVLRIDRHSCLY